MLFRFAPKVPLSSRRSAAAQVVWRSSNIRTGALGAVHVQRQADDDELGFDLLCHLADPGGDFVPGLDGDLRRDGRSQELGAVAGGEAGAAVAVIYC